MNVVYKLAGKVVNPVNRQNIYYEVNHDQGAIINEVLPHVGVKNLYFGREDVNYIMSLLNTAPGITEGIPLDAEFTERGVTETLNMYLNCMDGFKRGRDGIEASVVLAQSLDWLNERVQAFTFESLYNLPPVSFQIDGINYSSYQEYFDKRCIFIPYVISTKPNNVMAFIALASSIQIIIEISRAIKTIQQWLTPMQGMPSIGVAQAIAEMVFSLLLFAALIVMIIHFFDCLIQALKYHGAMLIVDLLKITAQAVGLTLESSIWETYPYNQVAYLPEKYNPKEEANPSANIIFGIAFAGFAKSGFTKPGYATGAAHDSLTTTVQKGYFNGMGGDFLRVVKKICNGKIIIPNNTNSMVMERRDYFPPETPFQLPDVRQDWNGWNTDEMAATIELKFTDDFNDKNPIDQYVGNILQATTQQITTIDSLKVNLKGLRVIQIDASRGIRKNKLDFIETVYKEMQDAFNEILYVGNTTVNIFIDGINFDIDVLNLFVDVWNSLMKIVDDIINAIGDIIGAISSLFGGSNNLGTFNGLMLPKLTKLSHVKLSVNPSLFPDRIGALLLENDMVSVPKILMVDTNSSYFTEPGGYSGQKRVAYLMPDISMTQNNQTVSMNAICNAQQLWNDFYFIDAFVGAKNNRKTKIIPANNHDSDVNKISLSLVDFKNLVPNPKFKDNFAEDVEAESIQWYPEQNGSATVAFRKQGWLADPQNIDGTKRAKEININLQIQTSLPNGQ